MPQPPAQVARGVVARLTGRPGRAGGAVRAPGQPGRGLGFNFERHVKGKGKGMAEAETVEIAQYDYRVYFEMDDGSRGSVWVKDDDDQSEWLATMLMDADVVRLWVRKHQYPFMMTEGSGSLGEIVILKGKG